MLQKLKFQQAKNLKPCQKSRIKNNVTRYCWWHASSKTRACGNGVTFVIFRINQTTTIRLMITTNLHSSSLKTKNLVVKLFNYIQNTCQTCFTFISCKAFQNTTSYTYLFRSHPFEMTIRKLNLVITTTTTVSNLCRNQSTIPFHFNFLTNQCYWARTLF